MAHEVSLRLAPPAPPTRTQTQAENDLSLQEQLRRPGARLIQRAFYYPFLHGNEHIINLRQSGLIWGAGETGSRKVAKALRFLKEGTAVYFAQNVSLCSSFFSRHLLYKKICSRVECCIAVQTVFVQ